jgi:CARDB
MRRVLLICALLIGVPAVLPAAASAASVRLVECVPAIDAAARSATFEARMHAARGSERMQVRFTLQIKERGPAGWRRVVAEGLDRWETSYPHVRRYTYAKTFRNLSMPASYRTVVRFRWLDDAGDVLMRARDSSRACRQPDMRPDLEVASIALLPRLEPGAARYEVALRNRGRTAAGPFAVAFSVGDHALDPVALAGLAEGEDAVVSFTGPACRPGEPLTAMVDAADTVEERDDDDNALVANCTL